MPGKNSKKNKKKSTRVGRTYELTAKGQKELVEAEDLGAQPKLIAQALNRKGQATSADLVQAIDSKVKTRQPVERVVGYYLTTWKSEGLVRTVKVAKKEKAPSTPPAA